MSGHNPAGQTLLVRNADMLVTMDGNRREIRGGGLFAEGGRITAVGATGELPATADRVIDLAGHIVVPGLVNTHHHMYQSLTRALPAAQDASLFGWLEALYPVWGRMTPEMLRVSTLTAMAELLLSGCTTSSDHLYLYPNGCRLDDTIESLARSLCALGPAALRQQKTLLRRWETLPLAAAIDDSVTEFGKAFETGDPQRFMGEFARAKAAR